MSKSIVGYDRCAKIPIYQVDAFTDTAFGGNPAAVCLLDAAVLPLADHIRQSIASEMNLSETAFLEIDDGSESFSKCKVFKLRWFTPTIEVPLCGHATLAGAAALFFDIHSEADTLFFNTNVSGMLAVTQKDGRIAMDFPAYTAEPVESVGGFMKNTAPLLEALCLQVDSNNARVFFAKELNYLMVVIDNLDVLKSINPNMAALENSVKVTGVIVCCKGEDCLVDVYSRFFAPWAGIPEDPVTGSAHSVLGPYYSKLLGKNELRACQISQRKGDIWLRVTDSRVEVSGHAVITVKGDLLI